MNTLYIIPIVYNTNNTHILEYRITQKRIDKRTNFYKRNNQYIINDINTLLIAIYKSGAKIKENRIILGSNTNSTIFNSILNKGEI